MDSFTSWLSLPMDSGVPDRPKKIAGTSILINFLLSWTMLPLALPPFHGYSLRELIEVLLWQGMGAVGWPLGLVGGLANLLMHRRLSDAAGLLGLGIYPMMLLLLLLALFPRRPKRWALALLHLLLIASFSLVWYKVLNGYDFMKG
jgi:hypothetical protein